MEYYGTKQNKKPVKIFERRKLNKKAGSYNP